jgi:hypothetical protein
MSTPTEIIKFLQNYNAWRRGDETLEMPHPKEIGENIQDAVVILREHAELLAVNATGAARLAHATAQVAAEREKVKALRLACERIVDQWDKDHDANPIGAGGRMYSWASAALAATEDTQ